jgi:hypothetical protein
VACAVGKGGLRAARRTQGSDPSQAGDVILVFVVEMQHSPAQEETLRERTPGVLVRAGPSLTHSIASFTPMAYFLAAWEVLGGQRQMLKCYLGGSHQSC